MGGPNTTTLFFFLNDIKKIIPNVDIVGSFYTWGHITFDELRWAMLVNMLRSDETSEQNDHAPEGDHSSHNSPLPSPQSESSPPSPSPRHFSTPSRFCHHFQTLGILPTTVLKEIKTVYRNHANFVYSDAWNTSSLHTKEEG